MNACIRDPFVFRPLEKENRSLVSVSNFKKRHENKKFALAYTLNCSKR